MSNRAAYVAKGSNYEEAVFYLAQIWDGEEVYGNPADRAEREVAIWSRLVGMSERHFWRVGR